MDILSIGYITTRDTNLNESLVPAANNGKLVLLQKNAAAKSRIQTYDTVQTVSSPEEALVALQNSAEELLVIETADPILADEYDDQDIRAGTQK